MIWVRHTLRPGCPQSRPNRRSLPDLLNRYDRYGRSEGVSWCLCRITCRDLCSRMNTDGPDAWKAGSLPPQSFPWSCRWCRDRDLGSITGDRPGPWQVARPRRLSAAATRPNRSFLGSLVERSDSLANDAGRPESPVRTESNEVINAAGDQTTQNSPGKKPRPLVAVVLDDLREPYVESDDGGGPRLAEVAGSPGAQLQQVSHEDVVLVPPKPPADFVEEPRSQPIGKLASYPHDVMEHPVMEHPVIDYPVTEHDTTCDGCVHC